MRQFISPKIALALLGFFIAGGCILTGTFVITVTLADKDHPVTITNDDFAGSEMQVDLSEDEDFRDNKDKIESIDNIGFYLSITNHAETAINFQIFLDGDTSANYINIDTLVRYAALVFTGLEIPAGEHVVVDWGESIRYVTGLDELKSTISTGIFSAYPVAIPRDDFDMTIDSMVVIVTLTGG